VIQKRVAFETASVSADQRSLAVVDLMGMVVSFMEDHRAWQLPMRLTVQFDIVDRKSDIIGEGGLGVRAQITIDDGGEQ
jgi:hypothetical protein